MQGNLCFVFLIITLVYSQEKWDNYVEDVQEEIDLERRIINSLLPGSGDKIYNGDNRPPPSDLNKNLPSSAKASVLVQINVYLDKAVFDEEDKAADLEVTLRQEWTDTRLIFESGDELPDYVSLPIDQKIWLPDTTFFAGSNEVTKPAEARMQFTRIDPSSGNVMFSKRHTIESMCEPSSSAFPLSSHQECHLKIGSYGHTSDKIVYLWRINGDKIQVNPDMQTQDGHYYVRSRTESCQENFTTGSYSCLLLAIEFSQSVYGHIIYFFIPSILLVVASWLHFWIHGSWSVPRTISAFLPFSILTIVLFFYDRTGNNACMSAQSWWLLICVLLTFLSLLEYFIAICVGVIRPPQPAQDAERPLLNSEDKSKFASLPPTTKLDYLSRFLFPVLFIIFVIIYLLCYLL